MKNDNQLIINDIQSKIDQCTAQIDKINELTNKEIIEGNENEVSNIINDLNNKVLEQKKIYEDTVREARLVIEKTSSELAAIKALGVNKKKEIDNSIFYYCRSITDWNYYFSN